MAASIAIEGIGSEAHEAIAQARIVAVSIRKVIASP